ncbi:alcohol dehydrogenase catalytic domain-containing protein [Candidatus Bathyarchaeota archaeon]|nr:alcohol dehydrogenase catalytic domain-containing protein [Candidatus Bathyarchaeota archaeon]
MLYFKGEKEPEKLKTRLPMCLLHEGVAEVVDADEGAKVNIGTKVVVNPLIPCGECYFCKGQLENLCQNAKYMAATADGLARTLFLYPEDRVLPIPDGVDLEVATLTEPLSVALNAFEESGARIGNSVAVIGDGPIGYLLTLVSSYIGNIPPTKLYLIGVADEKLSLARDFASPINSLKDYLMLNEIYEKIDIAFEAAGGRAHKITIKEVVDILRPGGKCILLGISMGEVPVEVNKIVNKGLIFKGSTRSRMSHYIKALELLKSTDFQSKVRRIISMKRFIINDIDDLTEAFKYADTEEGESRIKPGRVLLYFP